MTDPLSVDTSDVDLVEHTVSKLYSRMRLGASGSGLRARISRRNFGSQISFDDLTYNFDAGFDADPPAWLIICDVISNTVRRDGKVAADRSEVTFGPGEQFLVSPPGLPYGGLARRPRLRFTALDPDILGLVVDTSNGDGNDPATHPVRILGNRPVSLHAQLRLQRCVTYIRDDVMATATAAAPGAPLLCESPN